MTKKVLSLTLLFSFLGLTIFSPVSATTNEVNENEKIKHTKKVVDLVCMQNAVSKRDTAVVSTLSTYQVSLKASLEKRRDGLVSAWKIEDKKERAVALKNVWTTFAKEKVTAQTDYYKARVGAWNTYRTERKACGSKAASEDLNIHAIVNE